jgi:tetratricopeptide (TPR) repeat protein
VLGQTLGHYRILSSLGRGGMGEVYAAQDQKLGRTVALKVLPRALMDDRERRARFEREARAVAALNHPSIVTLYSVEEADGVPFLTMELVEGQPLSRQIPSRGMPLARLLEIAIPLVSGVSAAHEGGVIHRDLKPANVMVGRDGRVKVFDFGLAQWAEAPSTETDASSPATLSKLTEDGRIVGTTAYMSPEQAQGKPTDARSDIFSLGIVLYEMATGQRPFAGETAAETLSAVLRDTPASVTELRPDLPAELGRIVRRCLEKDRARRPQSALDLHNELQDLSRDSGARSGLEGPAARQPLRLTLVAALSLLAAVAYFVWRSRPAGVPAIDAKRVVVAAFENRTGDPSLGALGQMASEALVQGIRETGVAEVVPAPVAAGDAAVLSRRHRAATVVAGAYYLEGDNVRFQPSLVDAFRGEMIFALDPVRAPRQAPDAAIEAMRQRVMGALAVTLGPPWFFPHARPPVYAAFREMAAGLEVFGKRNALAEGHFKRAVELDPTYFWPAMHLGFVQLMQGRRSEAEAVVSGLVANRDQFSPFERSWLDWLQGALHNRPLEQLRALRLAEELEPDNHVVKHNLGVHYTGINQPRAAVLVLSRTDFSRADKYAFSHWFNNDLAAAHHILAEYDAELAVARRTLEKSPGEISVRAAEARALAALGRLDELDRSVGEALTLPADDSWNAGSLLAAVASELRAHDRHDAAPAMARRYLAWARESAAGRGVPGAPQALGRALYLAEEWDEARAVFAELTKASPGDVQATGYAGTIAARKGDRALALRRSAELRGLERPYLFGRHTLWRARIASLLGEKDEAVGLLREAIAQGVVYGLWIHRDMDLEPLRGVPAFEELVRPKG